jgi:serine/threonine-protein kinase
MDYVPGKDLRELMMEARRSKLFLDERRVLGWTSQLADALAYLHSQNPPIIHRDIKPSNLKITPNGLLKLVDFGLVKILAPDEVTITIIQGQGTALYTPLEQYGGNDAHTDVRADIYSFGATIYHILTNDPPAEARKRFLHPESLTPPREINPLITARTERAILWAMALHPDERPKSMEALGEVLFGTSDFPTGQVVGRPIQRSPWEFVLNPPENILVWTAGGLLLISLIATLMR